MKKISAVSHKAELSAQLKSTCLLKISAIRTSSYDFTTSDE